MNLSDQQTSATSNVVDVTVQNFQEVIERSQQVPVLLEFYADGAEQSAELAFTLNKLVDAYQGKFVLGRVNVQQSPQIVQQLGIRTLPTVKIIFHGQMVQDLEGPQEETSLREMLDQLTQSPVERIQEQIQLLLEAGNRPAAIDLLQQVLAQEPNNHAMQVELADLLIMDSRADEARQLLAVIPDTTEGLAKPKSRLGFVDQAATLPALAFLHAETEANPDDLQLKCDCAIRLIVDDQIEAALDLLLEVLQKDKSFGDELARKTMIQVFDMLGKGDPMATAYRRRMFSFLH